jgi:hypothetical protein
VESDEIASVAPGPKPRPNFGLAPRARSLGIGKLTAAELAEKSAIDSDAALLAALAARPTTRAGCAEIPRPCPYASCRYNLAVEITDRGAARRTFPDRETWEDPASCALDVAERGGVTLEEIGRLTNCSMQATSAMLEGALAEIRQGGVRQGWANFVSIDRVRRIRQAAARLRRRR